MSLVTFESEDTSKNNKKQSWFRRHSLFSSGKTNKKAVKKKSEAQSFSDADVLSLCSAESSRINKVREKKKRKSDDTSTHTVTSDNSVNLLECPLCLCYQSLELFSNLSSCHHKCCTSCMRRYLTIEITENRINLTCPECPERLTPTDVQTILKDEPHLLVKWEEFLLRRVLSVDPDCRWCPAPDCGYAVIAYGCASCPRLTCERPDCKTEFCYHCRQVWHHNQTCDSAHLQRTKQLRRVSNSATFLKAAEEIKPCPKCGAFIVKVNDGSCNHMTCSVCEAEFCWLCLQEITDLHYLSPSGCTFWGKKQWSRKKQILWQLGLLVGAPLGIGLVAGIALPVITFGLPVLTARKIRDRCDMGNMAKRSRNALVVGGVMLAVPFSPIVAALAVGLGVPILLLYVYCVVPFSLCRNGTYGMRGQMRNGSGGGLNLPSAFRFGDLGSTTVGRPSTSQEDNFGMNERANRLNPTNPSIGEASVGGLTMGSLNLSHASNLDKAGRVELDGASMRALAGTSITGSISGISSGPTTTNRMDAVIKEGDQISIQTHHSSGSANGVTAVQIHTGDSVSEQSVASFTTSINTSSKKSYSSLPPGARRKTQFTKRSASVRVTGTDPSEHRSEIAHELPAIVKSESSSPLTIVDECQILLVNETQPDLDAISSDASHTSLDSGTYLLPNQPRDHTSLL